MTVFCADSGVNRELAQLCVLIWLCPAAIMSAHDRPPVQLEGQDERVVAASLDRLSEEYRA